jgi:alpha-tubulin suppressor-like RCC1 family protein
LTVVLLVGCGDPRRAEVVPDRAPEPVGAPQAVPSVPEPEPAPQLIIACEAMPPLDAASLPKLLEIVQPFAALADAKQMVALTTDNTQGCAIDCDGRSYCWTIASEDEIGEVDPTEHAPTRELEDIELRAVQRPGGHICGLRPDRRVVCRGNNYNGQLGVDDTQSRSGWVEPLGVPPASRLVLSSDNSCALTDDGVFCWGGNYANSLGLGPGAVPLPTRLPAQLGITDIALTHTHACAVGSNGAVWCWGEERFGNLGCRAGEPGCGSEVAVTADHVPVQGLPPARAIAVGYVHSCALTVTGEVWCWGSNESGQCGGRESPEPWKPRRVEGLPPMVAVAANGYHSCARSETGELWCWGQNPFGETGPMDTDIYRTPIELRGLPKIAEVSLGNTYTCVRTEQGQILCWGVVLHSPG